MLREWRVEEVHEMRLDGAPNMSAAAAATLMASITADTVLFLIRPTPGMLRSVAMAVSAWKRKLTLSAGGVVTGGLRGPRSMACALTPRKTFLSEQFFRDEGLYDDVSLLEYPLELLPTDDDCVSVHMDTAFADLTAHGDTACIYALTRGIMKLQAVFGVIPSIRAKGPASRALVESLLRVRREEEGAADAAAPAHATAGLSSSATGATGVAGSASASSGVARDGPSDDVSSMPSGSATITVYVTRNASMPARAEIHSCVILDRAVDLVTPFMSPLTLEGQIDEIFGIDCAMTTFPSELIEDDEDDEPPRPVGKDGKAPPPKPKLPDRVPLHLNANARLFCELRDANISIAGPRLTARARELQAVRDSVTKANTYELKTSDIKKFLQNIPGLQADLKALKVMVALTTQVQQETNDPKFMERWQLERSIIDEENTKDVYEAVLAQIAKRQPLVKTLRLLCLLCAVEGGLKQKQLDVFRHALIASYGFEVVPTLRALETCGLLWGREGGSALGAAFSGGTSNWSQLRKLLQLTADNPDVEDPKDLHYVTSGYAPLSVRLVQAALSGTAGWEAPPAADALRLLPGPSFNITQALRNPADGSVVTDASESDGAAIGTGRSERKVVLVVFIGGITHIEISCLRFIAERNPIDFIVLTTSVTNGSKLVASLVSPFEVGAAPLPTPAPAAAPIPAAATTPAPGKPTPAAARK